MRARRTRDGSVTSVPVIMKGGLNENVSSIELKGGELIRCLNYQIFEGSQGGYVSVAGYEVYDGQPAPSSVVATEDEDGNIDDSDREAARLAIGEVEETSGQCEGKALSAFIFEYEVYAFRKLTGVNEIALFRESPTGWVRVNTTMTLSYSDTGHHFRYSEYNFLGGSGSNSIFWVDGVNQCHSWNGSMVTTVRNEGMATQGLDKPTHVLANNNHLFLAYEGGSLQFSTLGDPYSWDGTTGASEIGCGSEITGLRAGVRSSTLIFLKKGIRVLQGNSTQDWSLEVYSEFSGAYPDTVTRLLGTAFFMDDRGVTNLEAVQEFGDFAANSISRNIYRTLQQDKHLVTSAIVSRTRNQYRLFFSNGSALFFSFYNKELRGVTIIQYNNPVYTAYESVDANGDEFIVFTSDDGYVYRMDSGTSFNGDEIPTRLSTAYYHYRSPRNWKRWKSVMFEVAAADSIDVNIKASYDYDGNELPRGEQTLKTLTGAGGIWDVGLWDVMKWGSSEETNRFLHYIKGISSNISISLSTSSKFARQHTLQNLIMDYELARRQL